MSLKEPTLKMSKSHADGRSRIILTDSPEDIRRKIKVALTDSEPGITYDPIRRPGISNLIEIFSHLEGKPCSEIASLYQDAPPRALKEHLSDKICQILSPIREKFHAVMADGHALSAISEQGAQEARANAEITMKKVRDAMGL
jgi:tryptophanyl-tRNA synthetase